MYDIIRVRSEPVGKVQVDCPFALASLRHISSTYHILTPELICKSKENLHRYIYLCLPVVVPSCQAEPSLATDAVRCSQSNECRRLEAAGRDDDGEEVVMNLFKSVVNLCESRISQQNVASKLCPRRDSRRHRFMPGKW
jgi:hypothetical protein